MTRAELFATIQDMELLLTRKRFRALGRKRISKLLKQGFQIRVL